MLRFQPYYTVPHGRAERWREVSLVETQSTPTHDEPPGLVSAGLASEEGKQEPRSCLAEHEHRVCLQAVCTLRPDAHHCPGWNVGLAQPEEHVGSHVPPT